MPHTIPMLFSKIHRATVTGADLEYEGSITVDTTLMEAAHLLPNQQVDVYNITNGERFTTYVIEGTKNSGKIEVNGAAARLVQKGDLIIICAYAQIEAKKAENWQPHVVFVDEENRIKKLAKEKESTRFCA